jgi:uncharacterized metal-binding protein YceD (DUF177 family)
MQHFEIFIDRLKEGEELSIDEFLEPSCLELKDDDELSASSPIHVQGRVYSASDWVIIDVKVNASVEMKCAMCNNQFTYAIEIPRFVYEKQMSTIEHGKWDVQNELREAILLEVPFFALCNGDSCRNIAEIQQFIRTEQTSKKGENKPFLEAFKEIK